MAEIWRLLDTGLAAPAQGIALSRALLEARHAAEIPNTLRFSRATRGVLLAAQQSAAQELDLDYCNTRRIPIQRRITGGRAWSVDDRQLLWELYAGRSDVRGDSLDAVTGRLCHAVATALSAAGTDARYRARRDIEVDGRVLGTAGFAVDGDAVLFQGLLLLECQAVDAFGPLRTPWHSSDAAFETEAGKRLTSLRDAVGRQPDIALVKHKLVEAFESELDVEFRETDLGLTEQARCRAAVAQIDSPQWVDHIARPAAEVPLVQATHRSAGGVLHATVALEVAAQSLKHVWFWGDAPISPARTLVDLEAALRGVSTSRIAQCVAAFFASRTALMHGFVPADFTAVVVEAARQRLVAGNP
jgi:lipoate-protein ligase A